MVSPQFKTTPDPNLTGWPKGIKYIIGNEGCERFSYYGMNAILYVYVVSLYASTGMFADKSADLATSTVHLFKTGVYALPMIGAIVADRFLGKYSTILWLSFVYCLGHLVLSMTEGSLNGLYVGLFLIAIGSGGIKPCVSAHVGDQFGKSNWHLMDRVYQGFYFIINFGSFFSTFFIPLAQKWFGWRIAFAIPGLLMFVATFVFWLGRKEFVHAPPRPGGYVGFLDAASSILIFMTLGSLFFTANQSVWMMTFVSVSCMASGLWLFQVRQSLVADDGFLAVSIFVLKEWAKQLVPARREVAVAFGAGGRTTLKSVQPGSSWQSNLRKQFSEEAIEGTRAVLRIVSIFFLVSIFWSLFDQSTSSWIRQAEMMDRRFILPYFGSVEILSSQIQALNPVLVMALIPLLLYGFYPWMEKRGLRLSALMRMSLGMALASVSFVMVAWIQHRIDYLAFHNMQMHVAWQFFPYVVITLAEVLVSITGLEFAYTQAPKRMKSTIMGFWLLSVALGNVLVALTARFGHLKLVNFFWVFAGLMALAALLFYVRSLFYVQRDYYQ